MVLKATAGTRTQQYVVLQGRVAPVSDFVAKLLLGSRDLVGLGQDGKAHGRQRRRVRARRGVRAGERLAHRASRSPSTPRAPESGSRNTVCNVLREVARQDGTTTLSTWAGTGFPATLPTGSTSAYVTPGSGQLFRQFKGSADQGRPPLPGHRHRPALRDAVQRRQRRGRRRASASPARRSSRRRPSRRPSRRRTSLGYKDVDPAPVPAAWSAFLPTGPRLSTGGGRQPQGS